MTQYNICIVQPSGYVHSMAFMEIAEAVAYSIRELGHEVALQINGLVSTATNIIFGAHILSPEQLKSIPRDTIIVNTEQLSSIGMDWSIKLAQWYDSGFRIWEYSEANIAFVRERGGTEPGLLRLGYQRELNRITPASVQDVDVLFYGSTNERRRVALEAMMARGLNVKILFGTYGEERDAWIARSKVVLNLHYYDAHIFEVVRVFYLLCNAVPAVGEVQPAKTVIEERFAKGIVPAAYEELADAVEALARDPQRLKEQRALAIDSIIGYPQAAYTRELL